MKTPLPIRVARYIVAITLLMGLCQLTMWGTGYSTTRETLLWALVDMAIGGIGIAGLLMIGD